MFRFYTELGAKWVELVQLRHKFRYYTKLGAKLVELVQLMHKFVPKCRIKIFHNKRTRSTPLYTKLMFWCVS